MTTPRERAVAAPLPDGRVLIAGGLNVNVLLSSAEVFDPATGSFTGLSRSMTTPREFAVAAPLPDGRVLIAGGENAGGTLSSAEVFDPATNAFTALSGSMTTVRAEAVAAALPDGRVLVAGGDNGAVSSAEVFQSAPEAAVAGGDFGDQTVGAPSAVEPLVVTNVGGQALQLSSASLAGANAGDFAITWDGCAGRRLAFAQNCTISVRFTPRVARTRSATLALADNEPTQMSVTLAGTGIAANSGPAGAEGPAGAQGPAGTQGATGASGIEGPPGPAGAIRLVSCKTITVKHKKRKVHRRRCTTRLITATATFTTTTALTTLERDG